LLNLENYRLGISILEKQIADANIHVDLEKKCKYRENHKYLRLPEQIKKDHSNLRTARCEITIAQARAASAKTPKIPSYPVSYLTLVQHSQHK